MSLAPGQKALMYARSGLMRSDASRSNYALLILKITIGGVARRVLHESLTIHDYQHNTPNTAMLTVYDAKPIEGAEIVITNGSQRLFAGNLVRVTEAIAVQNPGNPRNILWHTEAIDWTWQLNQRLVTARYQTTSATAIVADLVARFGPPGYVAAAVPALPTIDEVTFTNETFANALSRLAERIGGYTKVDYFKNVLLWVGEYEPPPAPIVWDLRSFKSMTYARDLSQIVTRAIVEGGGVNASDDVAPGSTELPVEDGAWYSATGGTVVSGPQRITYAGVRDGAASGSIVGFGQKPAGGPNVTRVAGSALGSGIYQYAYTWTTASGETTPGSTTSGSILAGPAVGPTIAPNVIGFSGTWTSQSLIAGHTYQMYSVWAVEGGQQWYDNLSLWSPAGAFVAPALGGGAEIPIVQIQAAPAGGPWAYNGFLYRDLTTGDTWIWLRNYALGVTQIGALEWPGAAVNTNSVVAGSAYTGAFLVGLASSPSGTTGSKLYRTAANGAQLKLLATIAAAGGSLTDTTADAALGANAPTANTSGLPMPQGQVDIGAATIPVANATVFPPTGGRVFTAGQRITYTSIAAGSLAGIPPTGDGAIRSPIPYNTPILMLTALLGVPASGAGAIVWAIKQGDPVNVLIVMADTAAQAALAALLGGGASGVQESYQQDRRLSIAEATAEAQALLARSKDPLVTVRYKTTDPQTVSGAIMTIDLGAPVDVHGTFRIQDVTISGFTADGRKGPTYDVVASSQRFTFEDLIRQLRK